MRRKQARSKNFAKEMKRPSPKSEPSTEDGLKKSTRSGKKVSRSMVKIVRRSLI